MTLDDRIAVNYAELSTQLQRAADFVVGNRIDVATRSMRSIATDADLTPPTFSRLARAIGYADFEELRDECRGALSQPAISFSDRASQLQLYAENEGDTQTPFLFRQASASIQNIEDLVNQCDPDHLEEAADMLHDARRVIVIGALASFGIANYTTYTASWISDHWIIAERNGVSLSAAISNITDKDVLLVISKTPYAQRIVSSVKLAQTNGAKIIAITDAHYSPVLPYASRGFIVSSDSPQFFSSYVATLVLLETLVGMLVLRGGEAARSRIASIEETNRRIGEYRSANS